MLSLQDVWKIIIEKYSLNTIFSLQILKKLSITFDLVISQIRNLFKYNQYWWKYACYIEPIKYTKNVARQIVYAILTLLENIIKNQKIYNHKFFKSQKCTNFFLKIELKNNLHLPNNQ
jgi:hypothetical protein